MCVEQGREERTIPSACAGSPPVRTQGNERMKRPLHSILLWSLVASIALVAALGLGAVLVPEIIPQTGRILGSASLYAAASLLALGCAAAHERDRGRPVAITGLLASLAALVMWLLIIWSPEPATDWMASLVVRITIELTILAVWSTSICTILLQKTEHALSRRMQRLAVTLFTLVALYFAILVWLEADDWWFLRGIGSGVTLIGWLVWSVLMLRFIPARRAGYRLCQMTCAIGTGLAAYLLAIIWFDGLFLTYGVQERLLSVLIILTATGTLISACLALIDRYQKRTQVDSVAGTVRIHLTCPRCGAAQEMNAGRNRCAKCQLRIGIDLEEPRCECGYLLYRAPGENCPECGRTIPPEDRWGSAQSEPEQAEGSPSPGAT